MIYSLEYEKQVLAGLLNDPAGFAEIATFIDEGDFFQNDSLLHCTVFSVIRQAVERGELVDKTVVSQRVRELGINFRDEVNPYDYIHSLAMRKVSRDAMVQAARELKKFTVRRQLSEAGQELASAMKKVLSGTPYSEIVSIADRIYNEKINLFEVGQDVPVNIFEKMEALVEERGDNPVEEFGMMGPHKKLNDIYGSLLRPGNITVVVARAGTGKTTWTMDYATKVAAKYDVPVLHFDNGEMTEEELMMRQCASLSGVPMHLLESGNWRRAGKEVVDKVRSVWPVVRKLKFFYYNVGGLDVDSMINVLKRFYYSKVGRGNRMIFCFDYIKTTFEGGNKNEWQTVGEMVDKFKRCVQKEILFDSKPVIPMLTSVQSNRFGITANRSSADLADNESIVSLSDRIIQFCSHMFILREKTIDEIQEEGDRFGSHKLICIKRRHLGKDVQGALAPVRVGDQLRRNFLNFDFNNFLVEEKGDLRDIVRTLDASEELSEEPIRSAPHESDIPEAMDATEASELASANRNLQQELGLPDFDSL